MTEENLAEKEQIKIFEHYISELCKYIEETATILGLDTSATILGKGCIEYWAVLSSASNNAIKKLQHENGELKNGLDLYKTWYRAKHDDVKNCLGCYRKALEEIEKATKINCEEICGRKFEDCNDTSCFQQNFSALSTKRKEKGMNKLRCFLCGKEVKLAEDGKHIISSEEKKFRD